MFKNNRISKYFLYATSEIILVVIGILIALQVNNWNPEGSLKRKQIGYLEEIQANLVENSLKINQIFEFNINKKKALDKILSDDLIYEFVSQRYKSNTGKTFN